MSRKTMGLMARTIAQSLRFVASTIVICAMAIGTSAWASVAQTYDDYVPSDTPTTVFTGVSLSELGTKYALGATFGGAWMQAGEAFPWTFSRTEDSLIVEFRRLDTASSQYYTKSIPVTFTQNGSDIQAVAGTPKFAASEYLSATPNSEQTSVDGAGNPVYRVSSLTLTSKNESINISFTHNNEQITDTSIISGVGQYAIAGTNWDTFGGWSTSATGSFVGEGGGVYKLGLDGTKSAVDGATVKVEGSRGSWYCTYNDTSAPNVNGEKYLLYGYIDDDEYNLTPKVTITGVPFTRYRVVTYFSTDTLNRRIGPIEITDSNGSISLMGNSEKTATITGSDFWGGADWKGPLQEGKNYLVSPLLSGNELTIQGKANSLQSQGRAGISAISIVEVLPATVNVEDGDTYELDLEAAIAEAGYVQFVCDGTFTLTGTEGRTITETDIANYLDFTDVTGVVKLGAYTLYDIGEARTLPNVVGFVEGSTVGITETREEFLADLFTVSGLTGVSYVKLTRADGTVESLEVVDGEVTFGSGNGTAKIDGVATIYDATFTNTTAFAYKNSPGATIGLDAADDPKYNNELNDETTGIYIRHHPYVNGATSDIYGLSDFTVLVVGQMSPTHKTQFIHLGSTSGSNKGLLIATTENNDEVIIAPNTGKTVDTSNAVTVTVPNAATARHAYVITKVDNTFTVSVDGIRRGNFTVADGWTIGAAGHSGVQVGSDFGGEIQRNTSDPNRFKSVANSTKETGVINVMRVFDYVISDAQMQAIVDAYPYESEGGLYTRKITGDADFSSYGAWDRGDESYTVPVSAMDGYNPSATITVEGDATVTVNATLTLDTLTVVGGAETLTFAKSGDYAVKVSGAAVFNSPVAVEYGSLDLAGTPVQIGSAGSLTIDCSSIDVASIYTTTHYQLTGLTDEDSEKFKVLLPEAAPYREVAAEYNANGYYELVVTPEHEAGSDVYYKQGYWGETDKPADVFSVTNASGEATIVFPGDTVVVPAYATSTSAYAGSPLPANVSAIRIERDFTFSGGDTGGNPLFDDAVVTVSDGCVLTIQRNWHDIVLGSVVFNGSGVVLDSNNGTITVSGAVAGTSTLTVKENKPVTVVEGGSINNAIMLEASAMLIVSGGEISSDPTSAAEGYHVESTLGDEYEYICVADVTESYAVAADGVAVAGSPFVDLEQAFAAANGASGSIIVVTVLAGDGNDDMAEGLQFVVDSSGEHKTYTWYKQSGFVVLASTIAKLPSGVTNPLTIPEGKNISYAVADALGILSSDGEIGDMPEASISFNEDGQPVVTMSGTANGDYLVTCTLKARTTLEDVWEGEDVQTVSTGALGDPITDTSASEDGVKFYKVFVDVTNK